MTPGSSVQALKQSNSPGSSARISAVKPRSKAAQASKNPLHRATLTDHNKNVQFRRMPVRSGGTLGAPSQHRSGIVQLGRMPPEAGGGGLTVANRVRFLLFLIITVKPVFKRPLKRRSKIGLQDRLSFNAGQKYCKCSKRALCNTFDFY